MLVALGRLLKQGRVLLHEDVGQRSQLGVSLKHPRKRFSNDSKRKGELFVDLDVSSQDVKVCFLNSEGDRLRSFIITNDLPGAMTLKENILNMVSKSTCEVIKIGLESTSIYSYHLAMFLHNDKNLRTYSSQVFIINSKQIANLKKAIQRWIRQMP